ncbi:MAG: hypothetical protein ACRDYU_15315 [Actinomycetes bacterium]
MLAVLVLLGADVLGVAWGATKKADFTVGGSPSAQTVQRGSTATYTVTMLPVNGFTGPVTLQASGLPNGTTASFAPATVSSSSKTSTLTVATTSSTPINAHTLTVTGVSGKEQASAQLQLTVTAPAPPSSGYTLGASPPSLQVAAGSSAQYSVGVNRTAGFSGPVTLAVSSLPAGTTASFSPNPATGSSSALTVTTTDGVTPDGNSTLTVTGTSPSQPNRTTTVTLSVKSQEKRNFGITGNVSGALSPGVSGPVDLRVENSNNQAIDVTNLSVVVDHTSAGGACGPNNFAVVPYGGPYPLTVPENAARSLSQLGVPTAFWPRVRMVNLPLSQDACKGVAISLVYTGSAQGSN